MSPQNFHHVRGIPRHLGTYSGAGSPLVFLSTRAANETQDKNKVSFLSLQERCHHHRPRIATISDTIFQSTYQAIVDVLRREGLFGLYNGLNSSLLGIAVTNGCVIPNFFFSNLHSVFTYTAGIISVYYYFYESTKGVIVRSRSGTEALSTLESILAGLISGSPFPCNRACHLFSGKKIILGSATTVISNPVWVIQTAQTVSGMNAVSGEASAPPPPRGLGVFATAAHLLHTSGPSAFFRGLGPALVLVANPVLQYTVFEQLKNALVRRRRMAGRTGPLLTDRDFFFLGAISKLGVSSSLFEG